MLKRRSLIKGMAAVGLITASAPLSSCAPEEDQQPTDPGNTEIPAVTEPQTVYRLQAPRKRKRTCTACNQHRHYKIFLTLEAADLNRAHQGCNCKITEQKVSAEYFNGFRSYVQNGVADIRTAFG